MNSSDFADKTWSVSFKGLAPTDFRKCVSMAKKIGGSFSASRWTITPRGNYDASCLAEMADRGADIREA